MPHVSGGVKFILRSDSYVVKDFSPGAIDVSVKAGPLIGYPGSWSERRWKEST
jgi:hypothetical protein